MRKTIFVLSMIICFVLTCNCAWGNFYLIAAGKNAKKTVLVSPESTAALSGTALLNALSSITDASNSNPYLIMIEPGVYNIGTSSLQMKSYVDIQGSGENITKITGSIDGNTTGVLLGGNLTALYSVTVENTGSGTYTTAIYNDTVSSLTMENITAIASGNTHNVAVANISSFPDMTNMTTIASGGLNNNYGVYNNNASSPTMTNITATASGGTNNRGIYNTNASDPTMTNVSITVSGGTNHWGVANVDSSPAMTDVTITASGGDYNYSIYSSNSSTTMINMNVTASGGTHANYGVYTDTSSTVYIDHSMISGSSFSVYTVSGSMTYIGNTRLEGGSAGGDGTNTCASVCDENTDFSPGPTCP